MPIIPSTYRAKGLFKNGHFSTIYSAKLRPYAKINQHRERLHLDDGDFMDLDFSQASKPSGNLAILLHGLEGNAQRTYIKGQARMLVENNWDVCSVNYRGCSGEENLLYESYTAGKTNDLHAVISYILQKDTYHSVALVGFSLGGNLLLKYLGERESVPLAIKKGVAVSSPLSLKGSLDRLVQPENWVYRTSFLYHLRKKYRSKMPRFPEQMSPSDLKKIRSLLEFDHRYTAPAHGFTDAYDYYAKNSCLQFLPQVSVPVLILNALNDSFLSPECFPTALATHSKNIYLETPLHGGHVGFHQTNKIYYSESRVLEFLNQL